MRHFSRNTAIKTGIRTSTLYSGSAFQDATATNVGSMVQQENWNRAATRETETTRTTGALQ